ncbi:LCCL domain-containing protein [Sediminicoccus sp. KRV36]|uniref:LCCL domain-containing protein n=1 Tax=Sediminicoccus sp. KRV36 TaxID=3133721 RepID=UPI0020104BD6|nr:LCCL domain-containing protein [Sediminicoccus rosea]UPY38051.1 OmpA family protein [Sediminicoccus rosea]
MPILLLLALLLLPVLPPAAARAADLCPRDAMGLRVGESLTCTCIPAAVLDAGSVAGSDVYTGDSRICRAALHAGAVTRAGGVVTLRVIAGVTRHPGASRHGVRTADFGPWRQSFTFEEETVAGPRLCPDTMAAYAGSAERLSCICPGSAALRAAAIWGSNPYTADSALCRAALHAGMIPITGGTLSVAMVPGDASYAASLRNGVQTREFGPFRGGFTFQGTPNTSPGAPTQAPVLQALRREGRVALYINFRTDSVELDAPAIALLTELREALLTQPTLRLRLLGHTDNQGGPGVNNPLSFRRAQAVRIWLVREGIAEPRITAEGRGQNDPIAENTTEAGRALNRRVEALRVD